MSKPMTLIVLGIFLIASASTEAGEPPKGRVAYIADGNSPDPDDVGGNPATLALFRAMGHEKRLVHFGHSCDLVHNQQNISVAQELERQKVMQEGAEKTVQLWGGFEHLTIWNYKALYNQSKEKNASIKHLTDLVNASTADDPLWMIMAGEPDVLYFAIKDAEPAKRKFVTIITHHPANDNSGDFYNLSDITKDFSIASVDIGDQNVKLQTPKARWDWAKNHTDPRIRHIWEQGDWAERDNVVTFQKGKFDISDAGMAYYWLTGATSGGNKEATPEDFKAAYLKFIENPTTILGIHKEGFGASNGKKARMFLALDGVHSQGGDFQRSLDLTGRIFTGAGQPAKGLRILK